MARDLARDRARDWARNWARGWAVNWARDWAHPDAGSRLRSAAHTTGLDVDDAAVVDFLGWDAGSISRSAARARIATLAPKEMPSDEARLVAAACRASYRSDLIEIPGQGLWPALARHIARQSTPEDRALLEDLARHPEKREPPLSWGLQFIVRGDVMLEDGSVVTLDELCDQHGLPHLPYLEDMPPELDIDWDEESEEE